MSLQYNCIKTVLENTDDKTIYKVERWCQQYFTEKKDNNRKKRLELEQRYSHIIRRDCVNEFFFTINDKSFVVFVSEITSSSGVSYTIQVNLRGDRITKLFSTDKPKFLAWLESELRQTPNGLPVVSDGNGGRIDNGSAGQSDDVTLTVSVISSYIDIIINQLALFSF